MVIYVIDLTVSRVTCKVYGDMVEVQVYQPSHPKVMLASRSKSGRGVGLWLITQGYIGWMQAASLSTRKKWGSNEDGQVTGRP